MKLLPVLRALRAAILRCAALSATGGAIAFAALQFAREASGEYDIEAARYDQSQHGPDHSPVAIARASADDAHYRLLVARGVVGAERRHAWLQQLDGLREHRRILTLEYELGPQQPAALPALGSTTGGHAILASTMHLKLGLLHEQGLLDVFDGLRNGAAIVRARSCHIERAAAAAGPGQLSAECIVDWITLKAAS